MTHKQIEAARETRLWISQIVLPAAGIVVAALSIPEVREKAVEKKNKIVSYTKEKFKKD